MSAGPSAVSGRYERWRAPALVLVLAGLTVHTLVLMVLYALVGLPGRYVTVLSAWKEGLVALAAVGLVGGAVLRRTGGSFRWMPSDVSAAALVALVIAEGFLAAAFSHLLPLTAVLYGMRFYLVPMAAYGVGRLMPLSERDLRMVLWAILIAGGVTGLIALFERLLTDRAYVDLVESLGYKAYFGAFVNQALSGPGPTAASTWVDAGHGIGRRAGSVYLVSKPFALALLVAVPCAAALLCGARDRTRVYLWAAGAFVGLGLSLTYTRAAMAVGAVIAFIVAALLRRWQVLPALAIGLVLGVGLFFIESRYVNPPNGLRPTLGQTSADLGRLSVNDSSDLEHLSAWRAALKASLKKPLVGWGPGAGNEDSQRFVTPGPTTPVTLGAESVFLQVFEELGLVGLAIYCLIFVTIGFAAWQLFRRSPPNSLGWLLAAIMLALTVGVVLIGTTTPIWSGAFVLTYAYWWLAGNLMQVGARGSTTAGGL